MNADPETQSPKKRANGVPFWILLALFITLIAAGSWVLNHSLGEFRPVNAAPLPILGVVSEPFTAMERLGDEKSLSDLKGKVVVVAYAYSRCPHGCAGVAAQMLKLRDRYRGNPDVHLVSVAAWPETDTPEMLKAFAKSIGVGEEDHWWWLSTDRDTAWKFMADQIRLEPSSVVPPEERLNAEDFVMHDLRAAVLDRSMRVRSLYAVMHPQTEVAQMAMEKLERDIDTLLKEP